MRNNAKNREIEQLRAVSIFFVLIAHVGVLSPFIFERVVPLFHYATFGVGVDLFFCISGYVVAKAYCDYFDRYRSREQFWLAARMFWLRRIYRLLPSAWLWVVIGIVLAVSFNRTGAFMGIEQNVKSALAIFSFTANLADLYGWLWPNNVYWSLSLEEQFYFLFPFFLLLITGRKTRIVALLLVIAVQFPLARSLYGDFSVRLLALFRIDGFAWGILVFMLSRSVWYQRVEPKFLLRKPLALATTLLLFFLLAAVPAQLSAWPINMGLVAMIAAVLVWLASYANGYLFGYWRLSAVMQWLGARSYGIYLIHMPVFRFTHEAATRYVQSTGQEYTEAIVPFLLLVAGVLIVALAEINFRYIEEPLRRIGADRAKRKLAALEASDSRQTQPLLTLNKDQ